MATERPRIQAYLEPMTYDLFLGWKKQRGIAKESEAINQLLAEYFGVSSNPDPANLQAPSIEELRILIEGVRAEAQVKADNQQAAIEALEQRIEALEPEAQLLRRLLTESIELTQESNSLNATRSPEATARHENIAPSPEAISMQVIEACGSGNAQEDEPKSELPSELNLTQLARRLSISKSVVSNRKARADFEEWSREKDPSGIAWRYDRKKQKFIALAPSS